LQKEKKTMSYKDCKEFGEMVATAQTWKFLKCTEVYRRIINMFKRSSKIG